MKKYSLEEVEVFYNQPILELIGHANRIHCKHHDPNKIQVCSLISIKTGGCPEDCKYCSQSSRYKTGIAPTPLMTKEEVVVLAQRAIANGASRVCLGAAWREVRDNFQFERVIEMVKAVSSLGVEVCCTLGMITPDQARRLKEAGLYAYNHNLDTSEEYYEKIITTRSYQQRLETMDAVQSVGLTLCCGGILGLGESDVDRIKLLHTLHARRKQPESVPINRLVAIEGTPLANQKPISIWKMVRVIATARILMPNTMIRLSAGRLEMSFEEQALCFLAGANSIFAGDRLLTVANTTIDKDQQMFATFGIRQRSSKKQTKQENQAYASD